MLRTALIFFTLFFFILPIILVYLLPRKIKIWLHNAFYKTVCFLFRIKINVVGKPAKQSPILFTSNHISYLDILILGASLPASFISKAEVGNWPVVGLLAKLTGTILIQRKKTQAQSHLNSIKKAVEEKRNLILFPEGTTGDGLNLLSFKSSLFKIAEDFDITIQPISLTYKKINGLPVQRNELSSLAWIGDMDLSPHLKKIMKMGVIEVEVKIHEPISKEITKRKAMAKLCQEKVAQA